MQFYFIRHGQSENNLLYQITGSGIGRSEDPELTELGQQQVQFLARFLSETGPTAAVNDGNFQNVAGFGITHLYTSLMVRAVATGTVVADALGLPLVAWEDLHEAGGIYQKDEQSGERVGQAGKNRTFFEIHYPDLVLPASLGETGWWNRPYEEPEQRRARARRFLRDLIERHADTQDRVAVISHGGFFNYFVRAVFELPKESDYWFILNNVAIARIDFHTEHIDLVYANRVDFLPGELVT